MKLFAERQLSDFLGSLKAQMTNKLESENPNYLLNVNETQYVDHLVQTYQVDPLVLEFEKVFASDRREKIRADRFPRMAYEFYDLNESYERQVITYHIPYSGDERLLACLPSTFAQWSIEVRLQDQHVCFDIVNFNDAIEEIKPQAESNLQAIRDQYNHLARDVTRFNGQLENEIRTAVQKRKSLLLKQMGLLASLGVPIRKAANVPETFSVSTIRKRIIAKPSAATTAYVPEPTLDDSIYGEILRVIDETGKVLERHPALYEGKNEETLRDHFLMVLTPNFDSVSGETFNKSGKTDILIRHEQNNIFVAEYKFWGGLKAFHEAIDQLLGYLTWRDSKTALVCFIRNKELDPVLKQIQDCTKDHPCYVKHLGNKSESWFDFEFHLKGDPTRAVKIAVLCFHLP